MGQAVLQVAGLPENALDAAAVFHAEWLPRARAGKEDLVLVFPSATYNHRGWRLAAIQDLAREASPRRINAVAGDDAGAIAKTVAWLAQAPGITGQLLAVD
ncbi:MAG: Rossmann fold domain-containing protein [Croceibacterium sp.]